MAGARMRTKRTNLNQEGGEDEGQYAEHSRSYRGIGGGHRGNQEKLEAKDTSDKDEAAKRLSVKLEPIIRFFGSSTPKTSVKFRKPGIH